MVHENIISERFISTLVNTSVGNLSKPIFLQEGVFKNPVEISKGAYGLPSNPGWGLEMEPDFVKNHIYPEGSVWHGRQEPSGVTFLAD